MLKLLGIAIAVAVLVSAVSVYWFDVGGLERPAVDRLKPPPRAASTRPTTARSESPLNTTLLSELPRQAILIATAEHARLPAVDRSIDFNGMTAAGPLACQAEFKFGNPNMTVALLDAKGQSLKSLSLTPASIVEGTPNYPAVALAVERWIDGEINPLLPTPTTKPTTRDNTRPGDLAERLYRVDPVNAFLVARRVHELMDESGPSPERLEWLVRAYANLGDATRQLYSRHGSVFFARSLLYAERLVRQNPESANALAARGYAYALLGLPMVARSAFDEARKRGALPDWAEAADDLCRFRTHELVDRANGQGNAAVLSAYFALLTVEHSGLDAIILNLGQLAQRGSPAAARVASIMTENGGLGVQRTMIRQLLSLPVNSIETMADAPGFPKSATTAAATQPSGPKRTIATLAAMDADPASGGQLLPWGVYASIVRDELFQASIRRAYVESKMLRSNATPGIRLTWPILKDHRFARVLAGFDKSGSLGADRQDMEFAAKIYSNDLGERLQHMPGYVESQFKKSPASRWLENYAYRDDQTAYDLAATLHAWAGKEADELQILALVKGTTGETLAELCPDHPSALAEQIVNRWPKTKPRAVEIERDFGDHPQVAFALARAYRSEKWYEQSERLLKQVIAISPDPVVYEELADLYKEQGNADKWLELKKTYLAETDDTGLDHARASASIAYELMNMNRPDRALDYAKAAGDSGSGWGMRVYAACLTDLGRYEEAEAVERQSQQRFPGSFAWYRWCHIAGRGDLEAARAQSRRTAEELKDDPGEDQLNEVGLFYLGEGDLNQAKQCWQKAASSDSYGLVRLALLAIEQRNNDEADRLLESIAQGGPLAGLPGPFAAMLGNVTKPDPLREDAYKQVAEQLRDCLADERAVPKHDLPALNDPKSRNTTYRGIAGYMLGRFCELRGRKEEALYWYRLARDNHDTANAFAPLTADGLRRLGDSYYPPPK